MEALSVETTYENCVKAVEAIACLHNFLIEHSTDYVYVPEGQMERLPDADEIGDPHANHAATQNRDNRQALMDYFVGPGEIPAQLVQPGIQEEEDA